MMNPEQLRVQLEYLLAEERRALSELAGYKHRLAAVRKWIDHPTLTQHTKVAEIEFRSLERRINNVLEQLQELRDLMNLLTPVHGESC